MTHDPLCSLSWPCSQDEPDHGFCGNAGDFVWCIHCERECQCSRIAKVLAQVRQDERDCAVQRVEAIPRGKVMSDGFYSAFTLSHEEVIAAIKGEQ